MRRSSTAPRVGILALASLALVACEDAGDRRYEGQEQVFSSAEECAASMGGSSVLGRLFGSPLRDACAGAMGEARGDHIATAPRFSSQEGCEQSTGARCEPAPRAEGGSNQFIPALAGFLVGRAISPDGPRAVMPVYAGRPRGGDCAQAPQSAECAPGRSGGGGVHYFHSGGTYVGERRAGGFTASTTARAALDSRSAAISRGGLGGTGRGFSAVAS